MAPTFWLVTLVPAAQERRPLHPTKPKRLNPHLKSIAPCQNRELYSLDLPALRAFAHRLFIASESAFLWATLLPLLAFSTGCSGSAAVFLPILLAAHLALAAAAMFARPSALTFFLFFRPFDGA